MKKKSSRRAMGAFIGAILLGVAVPAAAAGKAGTRKPTSACEVRTEDVSFFRDQGLTMKLGTKLQFNKVLYGEQIAVKVSGGVAMLSGRVSSPGMVRTAVAVANEMEGIRCVQNFLEVGPPLPRPALESGG